MTNPQNGQFTTDGVVLRGPASLGSNGFLTDVQMGIFINENGDLVFRDNFTQNVLNQDGITLRQLYNKNKGVFVQLIPDPNNPGQTIEQLYFKDSTVTRAYSLEEIVTLCQSARQSLINGPLWWVGRTEIDHSECANIPLQTDQNNPNATNILWSIDKYLSTVTNTQPCNTPTPQTFYEKTIDPTTGEWVWWDVENLEIVLPPISDPYKLALILAKLSYQSFSTNEPIIFRLYDSTSGTELTRTAVVQANDGVVLSPVTLTYFGNLYNTNSATNSTTSCSTNSCDTTTVQSGNCFVPNIKFINDTYVAQSHLIKVQFHVIDYQPNFWQRVLGAAYGSETLTKSSIEVTVFNTDPSSRVMRQNGTADLSAVNSFQVTFPNPFSTTGYSVQVTPNQNVKVWITNKATTGFTINCSKVVTCSVDWTAILQN